MQRIFDVDISSGISTLDVIDFLLSQAIGYGIKPACARFRGKEYKHVIFSEVYGAIILYNAKEKEICGPVIISSKADAVTILDSIFAFVEIADDAPTVTIVLDNGDEIQLEYPEY